MNIKWAEFDMLLFAFFLLGVALNTVSSTMWLLICAYVILRFLVILWQGASLALTNRQPGDPPSQT